MVLIKQVKTLIPLILFIALVIFLWKGIGKNPHILPSALLNKPIPSFRLPRVEVKDKWFVRHDLLGKVSLVNVWATWCVVCQDEHRVLNVIASQNIVPIYGLDYKDNLSHAKKWLALHGNPYQVIGFDARGRVAINWGVYGTPETFLVDKRGIIRYKQVGAMTLKIWQQAFLPRIKKLKKEMVSP